MLLSDYFVISFGLLLRIPIREKRKIISRSIRAIPDRGSKNWERSFPKALKRDARNCQQWGVKRAQSPRGTVWMKKVRNIRWHTVLIDTLKTETSDTLKTETSHFDRLQSQVIPNLAPMSISGCDIPFSQSVRNLGFYLDEMLSMDAHIKYLCCILFYQLCRIGKNPLLPVNWCCQQTCCFSHSL